MIESERFTKIHDEIFAKSYEDTLYVFLCGGATDDCIRDNIRVHLESNGIQVLYPEDLFMEMMNKDRKSNLLDYENILAKVQIRFYLFVRVWVQQQNLALLYKANKYEIN